MHPSFFDLGSLPVHSYGVMVAIAFLCGTLLSLYYAKKEKISPENIKSLYNTIKKYNGKYEGYIHILDGKSETIVRLGEQTRLDICDRLQREADGILGEGATVYC